MKPSVEKAIHKMELKELLELQKTVKAIIKQQQREKRRALYYEFKAQQAAAETGAEGSVSAAQAANRE